MWMIATALSALLFAIPDLDGRLIDPFDTPSGTRAVALLFLDTECPISNRYAPEMRRVSDAFGSRGVVFWLVYANPREPADAIRAHIKNYGFPGRPLRDVRHSLVDAAGATVSSEVAVFDANGALAYRGRIDDRVADIGVERPPSTHDLADALTAVLAGQPAPRQRTNAVGCFLADLQ